MSFDSLATELEEVGYDYKRLSFKMNVFHHFHMKSLLSWPIIVYTFFSLSCILTKPFLLYEGASSFGVIAGIIFLLVMFNICLVIWNENQKTKEVLKKISWLAQKIRDVDKPDATEEFQSCISKCDSNYLHRNPSHSLIMIYQNFQDEPIPFPISLVKMEDIIALSPGRCSPCSVTCFADGCLTLKRGDIFRRDALMCSEKGEQGNEPSLFKFKVLQSPFPEEVKIYLQSASGSKLANYQKMILAKKREKTSFYLAVIVIPILFVMTILLSSIWFAYSNHLQILKDENNRTYTAVSLFVEEPSSYYWFELFFISPILVILPVLPITCPTLWVLLNAVGEARTLRHCFETKSEDSKQQTGSRSWIKLLQIIIFGMDIEGVFSQNARTFETLGSLTVLCCINKEGLLSWYDPAPEKVFFFKQPTEEETLALDSAELHKKNEDLADYLEIKERNSKSLETAEILTISQDSLNPSKIHFDDLNWSKHISSLKAIGLNILSTQSLHNLHEKITFPVNCYGELYGTIMTPEYLQLSADNISTLANCSHTLVNHQNQLEYLSVEKSYISPGVIASKKGLCSLTELIGFADDVDLLYLPKVAQTVYKDDNTAHKNTRTRGVTTQQPSVNLSYANAVMVSHWMTNHNYLMVVGSGDLLLNFCSHYWDGKNILQLKESHRRIVSNFCHRSGVIGHCMALSFQPVDDQYKSKGFSIYQITESRASDLPSNQIFLGVVSMQYQARIHSFHLIESLERACIRFVHFSQEDEFRARVFAEKMGLEVGWNCHISLSSRKVLSNQGSEAKYSNSEDVQLDSENCEGHDNPSAPLLHQNIIPRVSQSESSISESIFHVTNKAKLPCGVENIIPHIENIDNVPLLVPLFTDCEQESSRKMIEIMQKYGEVVCCIGSSDSLDNMPVFGQADVSVGLQPLLKLQKESNKENYRSRDSDYNKYGHNENFEEYGGASSAYEAFKWKKKDICDTIIMRCARALNTFPCSVTLCTEDSMKTIFEMITQARHFLTLTHISLILYMKFLSMVVLIQLLSHTFHLPITFAPADLVWLCYVVIPCLSFSLLGSPCDPDLMTWASLNNTSRQVASLKIFRRNITNFLKKFLPSCVMVIVLYILCLLSSCDVIRLETCHQNNVSTEVSSVYHLNASIVQCYPHFTIAVNSSSCMQWKLAQLFMQSQKRKSQQLAVCALVLYMCVISAVYVHRWKLFKDHLPFSNRLWLYCVGILFFLQSVYSSIVVVMSNPTFPEHVPSIFTETFSFGNYQLLIWLLFFLWMIPCIAINEFAKHKDIKMWTRRQKRARLAFGTKLGMNSPF